MMALRRSSASYVAVKVVRHAKMATNYDSLDFVCEDCHLLPDEPVTEHCGHTRCAMCIKTNPHSSCGNNDGQTKTRHRNILVRDIVEKMQNSRTLPKLRVPSSGFHPDHTNFTLLPASPGRVLKSKIRSCLRRKPCRGYDHPRLVQDTLLRRMKCSPEYLLQSARCLLASGRYRDASMHLVFTAASDTRLSSFARKLLVEVIETLGPSEPKRLITTMFKSVRFQLATASIDTENIECPVCYNIFDQPVTTPCGHTFCRACIERTMKERKQCPLCSSDLYDFDPRKIGNTKIVATLVDAITACQTVQTELLPILDCTVTFPTITCPLMIFIPRHQKVIETVEDNGMNRFAMVFSLDGFGHEYGTVMEILERETLLNGDSILTTVGVSRFRIIDKMVINGCPYASVQEQTDIVPTSEAAITFVKWLGKEVKTKAQTWFNSLDKNCRENILKHFGAFPDINLEGGWWANPNGPSWLWWIIAILPLRIKVQMLMLSTNSLAKRLAAVLRTFDAMTPTTGSLSSR